MTDDDMKPTGEIFYSAKELFDHLNSLTISEPEAIEEPPLPPLAEGEYVHIEYVQWTPVAEGGFYSNMVDTANTREETLSKLRELNASQYVFAIHVRRYPQPDKSLHAYDEVRLLPVAQSLAYMEGLRGDRLERAHDEIVSAKARLETDYEHAIASLEDEVTAYKRVAEALMDKMRRTDTQLRKDIRNCTYTDPGDTLNLLFGVGITPDEAWERKIVSDMKKRVRDERKHKNSVELAKRTGVWPLAPFCHGGASSDRRCACGLVWHQDEVPPWHNGLECQEPSHEEKVDWAKKRGSWPVAERRPGADPLSVFCACGIEWQKGNPVPRWHNGLECQPEPCATSFNGGMCAGAKGHEGACSPHPGDFKPVACTCGLSHRASHMSVWHSTVKPCEPCGTQLDAGPCAGTRRHQGDCTANADDIPLGKNPEDG